MEGVTATATATAATGKGAKDSAMEATVVGSGTRPQQQQQQQQQQQGRLPIIKNKNEMVQNYVDNLEDHPLPLEDEEELMMGKRPPR